MPDHGTTEPSGVLRIFFQEVRAGDRRKLAAQSNDAQTGGGARDLRVPHEKFGPLFGKMFPNEVRRVRSRGGDRREVVCNGGPLYWVDEHGEHSIDVEYEPPTSARPAEGRLTRIHEIPMLAEKVPGAEEGRCFLLLVQNGTKKVFHHYVTAAQLDSGGWNLVLQTAINECIKKTPTGRSVRGYYDFVVSESYCHA